MPQTYTEHSPLPMRFPATTPPVAGDHIDVYVWPGGWRFIRSQDRDRFEALPQAEQNEYLAAFDGCAEWADRTALMGLS